MWKTSLKHPFKLKWKKKVCWVFGQWQYYLVADLVLASLACRSKDFSLGSCLTCCVSLYEEEEIPSLQSCC